MSADLLITDALVFDGGGDPERVVADVRIVDGVVAEIGHALRRDGPILPARGRAVTPGLIDAHFHAYAAELNPEGIERHPLSYLALVARLRLRDALSRGFTTVRDVVGGDAGLGKAVGEQRPRTVVRGGAVV